MKKSNVNYKPTSGGEKALDYKVKLENKAKDYFEHVETKITEKSAGCNTLCWGSLSWAVRCSGCFRWRWTVNEVISGIAERDYILS